jgi:hypothetical protein
MEKRGKLTTLFLGGVFLAVIVVLMFREDKSVSQYATLLKFDTLATANEKTVFDKYSFSDERVLLAITDSRKLQKVSIGPHLAQDIQFPASCKIRIYPDGFAYVAEVFKK